MWSQFGRAAGGTLHDEPETLWFETPIAVPPYNMVVRFQGSQDSDPVIDGIFARFRERGVPFLWLVHPTTRPADLRQRLETRGFEEVEPITGMAMELAALPPLPAVPSGIEIHAVTPDHEMGAFEAFVAARWHVPAAARMHLQSIVDVARIGLPGSPNRSWLVVKDGVALAKLPRTMPPAPWGSMGWRQNLRRAAWVWPGSCVLSRYTKHERAGMNLRSCTQHRWPCRSTRVSGFARWRRFISMRRRNRSTPSSSWLVPALPARRRSARR